MLTFRSIAAAPTVSTAAACSLSSVPENKTSESVSSVMLRSFRPFLGLLTFIIEN